MFPTTGTRPLRTYTDPVATQEFTDALEASACWAAALVVEARQERQAQHDKAVEDLVCQLRSDGLPEYFRIGAGDFSEQNDRVRARTALSRFHVLRLQKIHCARVRRYERLKFAHKLLHPPFSHPEFPEDPHSRWGGDDGWNEHSWGSQPLLLTAADDELSPFILPSPLPRAQFF
ncbi:hypothetical protein B0H14DRAFT_3458021 [Mycena olivaceomarginata]|nr:hypothetical protein B0H14DRAFT_3458021 [Mycena olivaceomarginata]